jgi:hypothetical protein
MPHELVYTSAPKGLMAGTSGFCTVGSTRDMPRSLTEMLEMLSGYRRAAGLDDDRAPVGFSLLHVVVGSDRYTVLSRVAAAGLDYTKRTNHLAHHIAFRESELARLDPAWLLDHSTLTLPPSWQGESRYLDTRQLPDGERLPATCERWKSLAGDAGWGGVLAGAAADPQINQAVVIFRPGTDVLALLIESLKLLPREERWKQSFSTYYTKLPPGIACKWRFVLDGSEEAQLARRLPHTELIDLGQKRPLPEDVNQKYRAWIHLARHGTPLPPTAAAAESDRSRADRGGRKSKTPPPLGWKASDLRPAQTPAGVAPVAAASSEVEEKKPINLLVLTAIVAVVALVLSGIVVAYFVSAAAKSSNAARLAAAEALKNAEAEDAEKEAKQKLLDAIAGKLRDAETLQDDAASYKRDVHDLISQWNEKQRGDLEKRIAGFDRSADRFSKAKETEEKQAAFRQAGEDQAAIAKCMATFQENAESLTKAGAALAGRLDDLKRWCSTTGGESQPAARSGLDQLKRLGHKLAEIEDLLKIAKIDDALARYRPAAGEEKAKLAEMGRQLAGIGDGDPKMAAKGVFADLAGRPGFLTLPARPLDQEQNPARQELCKLFVKSPAECELALDGDVLGGGKEFRLDKPNDSQSRRQWTVQLHAKTMGDEAVARFTLERQTLSFSWLGSHGSNQDDGQLKNGRLSITAGKESRALTLRAPQTLDAAIALDVHSPYLLSCSLDVANCPREGELCIELSADGLPRKEFQKQLTLALSKDGFSRKRNRDFGPWAAELAGQNVCMTSGSFGGPNLELQLTLAACETSASKGAARLCFWARLAPGPNASKLIGYAFSTRDRSRDDESESRDGSSSDAPPPAVNKLNKRATADKRDERPCTPTELAVVLKSIQKRRDDHTAHLKKYTAQVDKCKNQPVGNKAIAERQLKNAEEDLSRAENNLRTCDLQSKCVNRLLDLLQEVSSVRGRIFVRYQNHEVDLAVFTIQPKSP